MVLELFFVSARTNKRHHHQGLGWLLFLREQIKDIIIMPIRVNGTIR